MDAVDEPAVVHHRDSALFSHRIGGSSENSPYLGQHWGAHGFVVLCFPCGDRPLPGDLKPRNPNHRAILVLSKASWEACLRGDAAARQWLQGARPRGVVDDRDRWQTK